MKEFTINKNDANQRMDRFLNKLLPKAPKGLLQKSLRKKNITLNGKKTMAQDLVKEGDKVQIYFSDATLDKFTQDLKAGSSKNLHCLYEDENIALIEKPLGVLTHSSQASREDNMVDRFIGYLIRQGSYQPRLEKTFTPAFCNRLDRNTSGILIGAKNAQTLRLLNEAMQERKIEKHYYVLVHGDFKEKTYVNKTGKKIEEKNKIVEGRDLKMETIFTPLLQGGDYSLLDANLLTGKTHQIRYHLQSLGYPILGDQKYGSHGHGQWLHNYKIIFHTDGPLAYLKDREVRAKIPSILDKRAKAVLGEDYQEALKNEDHS